MNRSIRKSSPWWTSMAGLCVALCVIATAQNVLATVLTMSGDVSASNNASPPPAAGNTYGPLGNGSTIVSEYGDNVAGALQSDVPTVDFGSPPYWYNFPYGNNGEGYTPNVKVAKKIIYPSGGGFNTTTATRSWTAAGDRSEIAYPATGTTAGGKWYWTFTADPGYAVQLISTDFVRFNSTSLNATVSVYSGDDPMSLGAQLYSSGLLSVNNVAQTISPNISGQALTLEFDLPAGDALFNWAADNIVIGQRAIPEPAGAALACVAAALWGVRQRRRRA